MELAFVALQSGSGGVSLQIPIFSVEGKGTIASENIQKIRVLFTTPIPDVKAVDPADHPAFFQRSGAIAVYDKDLGLRINPNIWPSETVPEPVSGTIYTFEKKDEFLLILDNLKLENPGGLQGTK